MNNWMIKNAIRPILLFPFYYFCCLIGRPENREWVVIFRLGPYTQPRFQIWDCGGGLLAGVLLDNAVERGCVWGEEWARAFAPCCLNDLKPGLRLPGVDSIYPFLKDSTLPWRCGWKAQVPPSWESHQSDIFLQWLSGFLRGWQVASYIRMHLSQWKERKGWVWLWTRLLCVKSIMHEKGEQ